MEQTRDRTAVLEGWEKRAPKLGRIAVVDDEPDFRAVVRDWLEPYYDVVAFPDGASLLAGLEQLRPDLLILDLRLPGPDGFAVCRRLAGDRRFQSVPVLFLTASPRDSDFWAGVGAGGTAYLTKPVTRAEVLARVEELLASGKGCGEGHWGP